jgi:protein-disulfide isomerase
MKKTVQLIIVMVVVLAVGLGIYVLSRKEPAQPAKTDEPIMIVDQNSKNILMPKSGDIIRGQANAPITLVEYSDFQCPYCIRFATTMQQALSTYNGQVKWVFRNYPLDFHQYAIPSAKAALAADKQGKFAEYSDLLFANSQGDGTGLKADDLQKYAKQLNLNIDQFNKDMASDAVAAKIKQDQEDANKVIAVNTDPATKAEQPTINAIEGTPATFLIDKAGKIEALSGAIPYAELSAKIEAALR